VLVQPSGLTSKVKEIYRGEESLTEAYAPMSVTMTLEDDIDVSRGNVITKQNNQPEALKEVSIMACWFNEKPLNPSMKYVIRHGTSEVLGKVQEVVYKMDISTLTRNSEDKGIGLNDIFKAKIRVSQPLLCDPYFQKPQNRFVDYCGRNE
jgi:sulfate adenylyltransferase subunit 1